MLPTIWYRISSSSHFLPRSLKINIHRTTTLCSFIRVWNLVPHIKGSTQAKGLQEVHNEDLHDFYSSPNIYSLGDEIKEDEMGGSHGTYGTEDQCIHGSGSKNGRRDIISKIRYRWKDNIKMYLRGKAGTAGPGFIWFRIGTSSRSLWIQ